MPTIIGIGLGIGFTDPVKNAGGGFDPSSIANLALWLVGDNAPEFLDDGWPDLSVDGRTVTVHDVNPVRVLNDLNGHTSVSFDGLSDQELVITPAITGTEITAFVVATADPSGSVDYAPFVITTNARLCVKTASSSGNIGSYTSSGDLNGGTAMSLGTFRVLELETSQNDSYTRIEVDGVLDATAANAGVGSPVSSIGNEQSTARYLNGRIAELLVYERVLTAGELTSVRNYLFARYALP